MDLARYFSTRRKQEESSHSASHQRAALPLLASPVNKDVLDVVSPDGSLDLEKLNTGSTSSTGTLTISKTSSGNPIIYRQHHEASTIELFYDLFFVANLAYFSAMHQHTDTSSLINYLKLFTLLWFTWLSCTLFDVRFSADSFWNRICKAIQFGVMTGFVFAGPVFDKYDESSDGRAYKNFALVLAISRFCTALQYFVVMFQSRMFRQTLLPVGLSGVVHLAGGIAFLITRFVFPNGSVDIGEQVAWFIVAVLEGLAIFLIAIFWRIVSFKYTHLVERLQLLTLIIIGEGIIGMVKSVACITKGQYNNNSSEVGTVVAAVLLLYLMWMLYFDQISHDRFGTVRQQIWSLLHYPLHMAVLLCVEGNTSLIVWNSAVQALKWMWSIQPRDYHDPAAGFNDTGNFIHYLNQSMWNVNSRFKSKQWNTTYYWQRNFTAIENYTTTYGFRTDTWNNKTGELVNKMFTNAEVFVFEAHAETLAKMDAATKNSTSPSKTLHAVYNIFNVTVMQFYIGAGAMLLVLAIMYWFNKLHKTKYEFGEMINRTVVGFGLIITGVSAVIGSKGTNGFKFAASNWIIVIVVFAFLAVLFLDNILLFISHHNTKREGPRHRATWSGSTVADDSDDRLNLLPTTKYSSHEAPAPPLPPVASEYLNTAYTPYTFPRAGQSQSRDFAHRGERMSTDSGVTLREESGAQGIGVAVTPPTPHTEHSISDDEHDDNENIRTGRKRNGSYESVETREEYEGQGYEGHPLRVRSVLE